MNRTRRTLLSLAVALFAVLVGMSIRVSFDWLNLFGAAAAPDPQHEALGNELSATADPFSVFTKVASFAAPSVVSVKGEGYIPTFFGEERREQAGSGIVIDRDGHILTNN